MVAVSIPLQRCDLHSRDALSRKNANSSTAIQCLRCRDSLGCTARYTFAFTNTTDGFTTKTTTRTNTSADVIAAKPYHRLVPSMFGTKRKAWHSPRRLGDRFSPTASASQPPPENLVFAIALANRPFARFFACLYCCSLKTAAAAVASETAVAAFTRAAALCAL